MRRWKAGVQNQQNSGWLSITFACFPRIKIGITLVFEFLSFSISISLVILDGQNFVCQVCKLRKRGHSGDSWISLVPFGGTYANENCPVSSQGLTFRFGAHAFYRTDSSIIPRYPTTVSFQPSSSVYMWTPLQSWLVTIWGKQLWIDFGEQD